MNPGKYSLAIAGLLFNGTLHAICDLGDRMTFGTLDGIPIAPLIKEFGKNVAANLGAGNIQQIFNFNELKTFLKTSRPDKLNHDLEKLFKAAAIEALGFVKLLMEGEVKDEIITKVGAERKEIMAAMKGISVFLENEQHFLNKNPDLIALTETDLDAPANYFEKLNFYLKEFAGNLSQEQQERLFTFFEQQYPHCFRLAFYEALKKDKNKDGFIAFQIHFFEQSKQYLKSNNELLQEIASKLTTLYKGESLISKEELQHVFTTQCEQIIVVLSAQYNNLWTVLIKSSEAISAIKSNTVILIDKIDNHREIANQFQAQMMEELKAIRNTNFTSGNSNKNLEIINQLKRRIEELESTNAAFEKDLQKNIGQEKFKTQFEKQIQIRKEILDEKRKIGLKLGFEGSIIGVLALKHEKKYTEAIKIMKNDLKMICSFLGPGEFEEYHEYYFRLVLLLVSCYLKTDNYQNALVLMKESFSLSKKMLYEYNLVELEKQFVIICEWYFEVLQYGINRAWLKKESRTQMAKNVFLEIAQIQEGRPFKDRTEAHRFELLKDRFRILLNIKNVPLQNPAHEQPQLQFEEIFNLGREKIIEEKYEEAYKIYSNLIDSGIANYDCYLMRGVVSSLLKDFDSALKDYDEALYHNPQSKEANLNKGRVLAETSGSNMLLAILHYDRALKIDPDYSDAYIHRGIAFIKENKVARACEDFHKALELGHEAAAEFIEKFCKTK